MIYIALLELSGIESAARAHLLGRELVTILYKEKIGGEPPEILKTEQGKPYFKGGPVSFSISHTTAPSGSNALISAALSDGRCEIGIDVEAVNEMKIRAARRAVKRFAPEGLEGYLSQRFSYHSAGGPTENIPEYEISFYYVDGEIKKCPDNSGIALLSLGDKGEKPAPVFVIRELPDGEDEELLRSWCTVEAVLKAEGCGFCGYDKEMTFELIRGFAIKTFYLVTEGGTYSVALAQKT